MTIVSGLRAQPTLTPPSTAIRISGGGGASTGFVKGPTLATTLPPTSLSQVDAYAPRMAAADTLARFEAAQLRANTPAGFSLIKFA